jgi:hypothetical protein
MRDLKELLQLMLKHCPTDERFNEDPGTPAGFCDLVRFMYYDDLIAAKETYILDDWIDDKLNEKGLVMFLFMPGHWTVRTEFLKQEILNL